MEPYCSIVIQKYSIQSYVHILVNGNLKTSFKFFFYSKWFCATDFGFSLWREGWDDTRKHIGPLFVLLSAGHHPSDIPGPCFAIKPDRRAVQVAESPSKWATRQIVPWRVFTLFFIYVGEICGNPRQQIAVSLLAITAGLGVVPAVPGGEWSAASRGKSAVAQQSQLLWWEMKTCTKLIHSQFDGSLV